MSYTENKKPVDEVLDMLQSGVKQVFSSGAYEEYLKTMSRFYNYSARNCLLIEMQMPGASYVAGYQAWKKNFDRQVNKGESAIRILAPCKIKKECTVPCKDDNGQVVKDSVGNVVTEKQTVTLNLYKVAYVFDISQTEGKELPELSHVLNGSVSDYESIKDALEKVAPCPVKYEEIPGNAHGYYNLSDKEIVVQKGMSEEQTIKTLIHEVTHSRLHDEDNGADRTASRQEAEVEAESVAYVVCQHLGIDSSQYTFGYVAGWAADKDVDELTEKLDVIRDTASNMINDIDSELIKLDPEAILLVDEITTDKDTQKAVLTL